ncbi:MAG: UbiD family decarboxylase [Chloroflexi bacterium]|nr:UbiD family decarboxylase [Chloroflexota bacterium]
MDISQFLAAAAEQNWLIEIDREVDPHLELAALAYALDGNPVLFNQVRGSAYRVVTGLAGDRRHFALALGCEPHQILFRLAAALQQPRPAPVIVQGSCQEVIDPQVDLTTLPFLKHWPDDAGAYATAAVAIIRDPDTGLNASYHRLLRRDARHCVARLVERRGTHTAWQKSPAGLPVAICIGLPLHILLAASMSPPPGVSELDIAQALAPTPLVRCLSNDLLVPAAAEFVLEGRITHELGEEGPFVDLTETIDIVRHQPVITIERISHRRQAIYQALLPGQLEHKLLMGMPKEPSIYAEVNRVVRALNVHITPGGASWLHAVVQIDKQYPDDGRTAIAAAFSGHPSLKHVVIVDQDIDPFHLAQVEWAIATRFQAGRDLVILPDQPSSSLDPSARHRPGQKSRSDKLGLDATIPWDTPTGPSHIAHFRRVSFPSIDPTPYLRRSPHKKP